MQPPRYELLRISLPLTRVNKGTKEGRSPLRPRPRFRGLAIPASGALATRPTRPGHCPWPPRSQAASLPRGWPPCVLLSPGCLVQLVPGVVLNSSLGHILFPLFRFLGLHSNKKPPPHSGRRFHQNKTQFSSTPQVYHGEGRSPAEPRPDCLDLDFR